MVSSEEIVAVAKTIWPGGKYAIAVMPYKGGHTSWQGMDPKEGFQLLVSEADAIVARIIGTSLAELLTKVERRSKGKVPRS